MGATDAKSVKFRASSVGNLLVGGNAITEAQLMRLRELEARKSDSEIADSKVKPLTEKMEIELAELIEKRNAPFRFGATAMSLIRDVWLKNTYGYEEPIVTPEMLKGIQCEQEAIGVLSRCVPGGFRVKNETQYEDEHFTGTPDIVGNHSNDWDEDIKCSWTIRTFFDVKKPDQLYYAQGQVYMALTGHKYFRLVHVLLDTPFEIVEEIRKKFFWQFACDEDDPRYIDVTNKIDAMHNTSRLIPENQRIKYFEINRNDKYIADLRNRVELARKVYASLTLGSDNDYE